MATSSPKRTTFRPLSELLPKNEAGDAEFQHVVSALLRFDVSQEDGQKQRVVPTRLGPGSRDMVGWTYTVRVSLPITGR